MSDLPTETRQWVLKTQPLEGIELEGQNAIFKLETVPLPELNEGQVLVKTLYLSNDPAQRVWIAPLENRPRPYIPPVEVGQVMRASSLAEVIASRAESIPKGAMVKTRAGWAEYSVQDVQTVMVMPDPSPLSYTHYLGALGVTGLTAYIGMIEIGKVKSEDVVVVSAAAGATGSMAVQVAKKLLGCKKVIGIAGSDEKCRHVEDLGADQCVNYKSATFKEDLIKATEDNVDVYFDNVGGSMLDLMLSRMRKHGRVVVCGAISQYGSLSNSVSFNNFEDVITQRLELKGFVVLDYLADAAKVAGIYTKAVQEGKIEIGDKSETVVPAKFEDIPKVWKSLYEGHNQGKLITKL
ncbi:hypothetical protein HIM_09360 [Hirsutella minnesotensis 3608]|uniref:Dehydrogenase FUB6 n=1 Tax=Hirsutella minnesotensis 3608 TaxID=1043627 RepID=A0A0F7ZXS2_9HYPO|nr:hypothetical protein HIM_09360 [Hirsutella minnesotensis 3608]